MQRSNRNNPVNLPPPAPAVTLPQILTAPADPANLSDAALTAEMLRRFTAGELLRIAVNKIGSLPNRDRHWLLNEIAKNYSDGARELGDFEMRRKSATQKG